MPETLPRSLVIVTAIVALVAISVGVKDYLDRRKEVKPEVNTVTPAVANSKSTRSKKNTSAKTKQARKSGTAVNAPATAQTLANNTNASNNMNTEKPLTSQELSEVAAVSANASQDEDETGTAMSRTSRTRNQFQTIAMPLSSACLPLPNVTKPGDVDAPYYENWAKEYCDF